MLNLPTTSTVLQVVTGSAVRTIQVHASWSDLLAGSNVPLPGSLGTPITGATITPVVAAPTASGIDRNVKFLSVNNTSSNSCAVTVQIFDGVNTIPIFGPVTLLPGWVVQYNGDGDGFTVLDSAGKKRVSVQAVVTVQGSINISAGTLSAGVQAVTFGNGNNVTFGFDGSKITASVIPGGLNVSAGTTSNLLSAITFANGSNVSFGLNGSVMTASVASSLSALNVSAGTTSGNVSAVTFANSNGVSFGLNNGVLTASAGGGTITAFSQDADFVTKFPAQQAALSLQKVSLGMNISATQLAMLVDFEGNSNSTDAVTISHAVYSFNNSTASLASSGSRVISWTTGSQTTASSVYGGASGTRYRTIGVNYSMTPGDYLFAWWVSTANGVVANVFGRAGLNIVGGFDGVETSFFLPGSSVSSVAAFPASIAATNTNYARTGFSPLLQPGAILLGSGQ